MERIKYLKIISAICLGMLFTGCGGKENSIETSQFQDQNEFRPMMNITEADEGVYYVEYKQAEDYMVIKYIDKKSAKETVLCQKVNCKHNTKECQAVVEQPDYLGFLTYTNGRLYYMVFKSMEDGGVLNLYSMNKDGTDKELVHEFKNQGSPPNVAGIYRGKVFLSLPTMIAFEDGTGRESAEPSLVMYDLKTKEEIVITDGKDTKEIYTVPCGGSGDSIYFIEMSMNEDSWCKLMQFDFDSNEIRKIWDGNRSAAQFIYDDTLYLKAEGKKKMISYHLTSQKEEDILEWEEDFSNVYTQIGYIEFVNQIEENGKVNSFYKWYDLEQKKYVFQEIKSEEELYMRTRLKNGDYMIEKNDKIYFYNLNDESWTEVERIM